MCKPKGGKGEQKGKGEKKATGEHKGKGECKLTCGMYHLDTGTYVHDVDFDANAFLQDVTEAKNAVGKAGEDDARHLHYLVAMTHWLACVGHVLLFLGALRAGGWIVAILIGVLGAGMISLCRCMRWTIIGHHVSHGGYSQLAGKQIHEGYRRGVFAFGTFRRLMDWLDWMKPEAWDLEHNSLHHYSLSEDADPDLVERNFKILRDAPVPNWFKLASMIFWIGTWKWAYYSPNTLKELLLRRRKNSFVARHWPKRVSREEPMTIGDFIRHPLQALVAGEIGEFLIWPYFAIQWYIMVSPMAVLVAWPAATLLLLSHTAIWDIVCPAGLDAMQVALRALAFAVLADIMTNAHSFVIIVCNHSGEDLYHFSTACRQRTAEFYLRCIYASANFETGSDWVDIPYGWLNYQVEHHMFDNMTTLQYRKIQPLIKSICQKHGVKYTQENAIWRTWSMLKVAVGMESMKRVTACLSPDCEDYTPMKKNETAKAGHEHHEHHDDGKHPVLNPTANPFG